MSEEWPETRMVACPFCRTERPARRNPHPYISGGRPYYSYSGPACDCEGAKKAREVSAMFNRQTKGRK